MRFSPPAGDTTIFKQIASPSPWLNGRMNRSNAPLVKSSNFIGPQNIATPLLSRLGSLFLLFILLFAPEVSNQELIRAVTPSIMK